MVAMHDVTPVIQEPSAAVRGSGPLRDVFDQNLPRGKVVGSVSPSGAVRRGVDAEGLISADHGALRFGQLVHPGWGRQGVAYGPYERTAGLALAVLLVNGHTSSRATNLGESLRKRFRGWVDSSRAVPFSWRWPLRYLRSHKKQSILEKLRRWRASNRLFRVGVTDNLAVGWFAQEAPLAPAAEGNAFVVDAALTQNPKLSAVVGRAAAPAVEGLQSNQIYYVVVLREQGAAYYAASLPGAAGLGAFPQMRPVAIDAFRDDPVMFAGVHQSVLGEIGFTAETRVFGVHVERVEELAQWYGTAHAADALDGGGDLAGSVAEQGGRWHRLTGNLIRAGDGVVASGKDPVAAAAVLRPDAPAGLVHLVFDAPADDASVRLVWRARDGDNYWTFGLDRNALELRVVAAGQHRTVACLPAANVNRQGANALQIVDDGRTLGLYLNGRLAFDRWFTDERLGGESGIGVAAGPGPWNLRRFEAHPRAVQIPRQLDLGTPWSKNGVQTLVEDEFAGAPATDLAGCVTPTGGRTWRREMGLGKFETSGDGAARVVATLERPNPLRTAYGVAWDRPEFADVQVDITPPGTARHQGHRGRGGILFWQDPDNYITFSIYLDDCIETASLAAFFYLKGFEDVYDAVWANLGGRVTWGERFTLRMAFDGMRFVGYINGEPMLYRALEDVYPDAGRLSINRVGLVANWEWGDDTGTAFHHFVARA